MQPMPHPESAKLVKIVPAKRQARFTGWKSGRTCSVGFPLPVSTGA
jgi:hypothetical protein